MVLALRQQGMLKGRSGAAPVKLVALAVEVVPLNHSPCKTRGKVAERTGLSVHTRRAQSQTTPHPVSCTLMGGCVWATAEGWSLPQVLPSCHRQTNQRSCFSRFVAL